MALYIIQVFKQHPLEPRAWSNRYLVESATLAAAEIAADEIVQAERAFHTEAVTFNYARVSTAAEGDDVYTTIPLGTLGIRTNPSDNLPLWNTVRVDIAVNGGGRPSRKFYRPPLGESDVNNYVVQAGIRSSIDAELNGLVASLTTAGTPLVDPDGQAWTTIAVQSRVQMRQLHRKRRRATP